MLDFQRSFFGNALYVRVLRQVTFVTCRTALVTPYLHSAMVSTDIAHVHMLKAYYIASNPCFGKPSWMDFTAGAVLRT